MFNFSKSKEKEIVKDNTDNVIRIESDEELLKKTRSVFRGKKKIGEISYKNGEWCFQCEVNREYFYWTEAVTESELEIILNEIKKLNFM